jgi:hypothetical protein
MKQTPLKRTLLAVAAVTSAACATTGQAQSSDGLLNKLIEKGIITKDEAKAFKAESAGGFDKAYQAKSGMPDWVTSLKMGGDLRLRYEGIYADSGDFPDRARFRYRLRPTITAVLKDNFEVGVRLTSSEASGGFGGDPISGNTSFSDNGSKKFLYIDMAYGKWTALNNADWTLALTGGKMENPLHFPGTDVFDKDYTPEGFAQELTWRINKQHSLKLTGAQFMLDEIDISGKDPYLLGAQLRWSAAWTPKISSVLGATYMSILNRDSLTTAAVPNQGRGNSRTAGGALLHGFDPVIGEAGLTYSFDQAPLYHGAFPVTASADYIYNHSAPDENTGYGLGFTLGKAGKKGTWQIDYRYTYLAGDAWYEEFPESDFGAVYASAPVGGNSGYRSGTNVKGHWVKASYSPNNALTLSAAYFFTELVHSNPHNSDSGAGRLQVDAVFKF